MITRKYEVSEDEAEKQFIKRLKGGDNSAWTCMFERFDSLISRIARNMLPSECIDDVVQDVHIRLFTSMHKYSPAQSGLVTWVMLLTKRRCIDEIRKIQRSRARVPLEYTVAAPSSNDTNSYSSLEEVQRAIPCINGLRQSYQEVLNLVYKQGLTLRLTAETLQIPLGTAKTRLNRGLSEIREQLEKENKLEERQTKYRQQSNFTSFS